MAMAARNMSLARDGSGLQYRIREGDVYNRFIAGQYWYRRPAWILEPLSLAFGPGGTSLPSASSASAGIVARLPAKPACLGPDALFCIRRGIRESRI